MINKSIIVNHY